MRKTLILLCTLLMCLGFTVPSLAAPTVILDNQRLSFDVPPTIENGRTLVPLRAIFEALGADVEWDGQTRTVTAAKDNIQIKLQIGSTTAYKNDSPVQLDVPAKIINNRTLVPLRFVSEALGAKVDWYGPTQTITITSSPVGEGIEVHFIDVGQADAIYIKLPDRNDILIDGGNRADGPLVVNYLQGQEVDDIELLIATHPHEDHIGGLPDVLDAFVVEKIIDSGYLTGSSISRTFEAKAKAEGSYVSDGYQSFSFDGAALNILTGNQVWDDVNNYSVVCRLDTGDVEFLFMGDAETPVENILSGELESEILKVGHHGSLSSTSEAFLSKVKPEVAVISCGAGNRYGHPHRTTLTKLENIGADIYRTDLSGNIIVGTDGTTYTVTCDAQAPVGPSPIQQPAGTPPEMTTGQSGDKYSVIIADIDLQGEVVTIKNNSNWSVDMTGWYLVSVTGDQTYYFPPGFVLGAEETVYITSGRNARNDGVKYLKWTGSYIWNNDGDPGKLYNNSGALVSEWPGK